MLKIGLIAVLLLFCNTACAHQEADVTPCPYSEAITQHIAAPPNAKVSQHQSGVDIDSHELTKTHIVEFVNGDVATIEQKYCSMYNFSVIYTVSSISEQAFKDGLKNIHRLIDAVEQNYHLKAPLEDIVNMTMNQRKLSLQDSFGFGLPGQAVTSDSHVEHSLSFTRLPGGKTAKAEIHFYFALDGM